jgi:hypothetical protein
MSDANSEVPVEELLNQGKEAIRAGDKGAARSLFEQVVVRDQNSEQGWFWLAAAVDDINEKRTCLGNVLTINPNNERARNLLAQLQSALTSQERAALTATSGGTNRNMLYLAAALGVVAVLFLLVAALSMSGGDGDDDGGASDQSQPGGVASRETPQGVANPTQPANTLPPGVTPTPSQTPLPPPPTWTPRPSNTPVSNTLPTVFPPPPPGLPGQIIMRSGPFMGDPDNQSIALIAPDGSGQRNLTPDNSRGHAPVLSPDSSLFAYVRRSPDVGNLLLFDNIQGSAPATISAYWGSSVPLFETDTPAWAPDGAWIAFTAQGMGSATPDLYRVSLASPNGTADALQRLTGDDAVESWPAWSPDSQRIVYVADLAQVGTDGSTELRIYNTADAQITNLTNNGAALIEGAPDWSPDGQWIVFHAQEAGSAETDIYRMTIGGTPERIIDSDANDIQPRFSPDGRHIVFSSDRSGNWEVYIYELATSTFYQVTTSANIDVASDWGR